MVRQALRAFPSLRCAGLEDKDEKLGEMSRPMASPWYLGIRIGLSVLSSAGLPLRWASLSRAGDYQLEPASEIGG